MFYFFGGGELILISAMAKWGFDTLWLDIKNVLADHTGFIGSALEALFLSK